VTAIVARAVMRLAARSLGESRRDWALAMQGEFEAAIEDRRPLAFATGCLIAAWREMPAREQGRFALASHALALGLLIPMAGLQLACAAGFPQQLTGQGWLSAVKGTAQVPYLADAGRNAVPAFIVLWLLLGMGHLRLAWVLLERDWSRVARIAALMAAASATLIIFTGTLFLDDAGAAVQAALLGIELSAVYAFARWHDRLYPGASSASLAW
jgi:hypothetical protein